MIRLSGKPKELRRLFKPFVALECPEIVYDFQPTGVEAYGRSEDCASMVAVRFTLSIEGQGQVCLDPEDMDERLRVLEKLEDAVTIEFGERGVIQRGRTKVNFPILNIPEQYPKKAPNFTFTHRVETERSKLNGVVSGLGVLCEKEHLYVTLQSVGGVALLRLADDAGSAEFELGPCEGAPAETILSGDKFHAALEALPDGQVVFQFAHDHPIFLGHKSPDGSIVSLLAPRVKSE